QSAKTADNQSNDGKSRLCKGLSRAPCAVRRAPCDGKRQISNMPANIGTDCIIQKTAFVSLPRRAAKDDIRQPPAISGLRPVP
ncbi:MAG: hypothetical protein ACR2P4_01395, partial [Gammaproteobacteria bacterium]